MSKRILDKRKEHEAAEARKGSEAAPKKKGTKKATKATTTRKKRTKEKAVQRKRLVWAVFNGSMKEEARFPYDQRTAAEEKIEQLRAKSKKQYFIQPVKEVISEPAPVAATADEE